MQFLLNAFNRKTRLSQGGLFPDVELRKNIAYNIRFEKCQQSGKKLYLKIVRKIEWLILLPLSP